MSRRHTSVPVTSVFIRALAMGLALMVVGAVVAGCEKEPSAAGARPVTTAAIYADYPGYPDAGALVDGADAVIVGVVSAAESRQVDVGLEGDPAGEPYLVSTVKVEQVIKGGVKAGDTMEVKQLLSADSPLRIWLEREGMRVLLFLAEFPGFPYSPLNPLQAVVSIEAGKIKVAPGSNLFATPRTEEELVAELDGLVD